MVSLLIERITLGLMAFLLSLHQGHMIRSFYLHLFMLSMIFFMDANCLIFSLSEEYNHKMQPLLSYLL